MYRMWSPVMTFVFGNGIAEPGDAKNHTETLLDAYNLGKSL